MEIQFTPHVQAELDQLVTDTGCPMNTLVNDMLAGILDEQARVRNTLDSRYDDIESRRVELISGEHVRAIMHEKSQAYRTQQK